ncbi:molybdopterin synthase catalytic subunit-like [Littorina saxatilis]|uniref:Molybdopterin synthase catalytic subunit n=1 Tax=Littorina saxatilis TaxID=31220 RepID=A0AAN9C1C6_9CAEN
MSGECNTAAELDTVGPAAEGGQDHVDVVEDKLSVEAITAQATSPTSGAVALFVGTTRNNFDGKSVLRLEYEAYMPMAKKKMLETCELVRSKWEVENIVMIHRIGVVPVQEASIVIAVSSPHRKEALEAVHFAIDHVKATVPVWKKEIYGDESSSWKQNQECKWSGAHPPAS